MTMLHRVWPKTWQRPARQTHGLILPATEIPDSVSLDPVPFADLACIDRILLDWCETV